MSRRFPDLDFHALFLPEAGISPPDYEPEPIGAIHVVKNDPSKGVLNAPRAYAPDEIPDLRTFFEMFGGGSFQLVARRPAGATNDEGKNVAGSVYAKRNLKSDLPTKPWPGFEGSSASSQVGTAPASPPIEGMPPMMMFMLEQMREDRRRADDDRRADRAASQAMTTALITALAPIASTLLAPKGVDVPEMLRSFAELTKANTPPPQPPSSLSDALALGKVIRDEARDMTERALDNAKSLRPEAPERPLEEEVSAVLQSAMPLLGMFTGGPPKPAG